MFYRTVYVHQTFELDDDEATKSQKLSPLSVKQQALELEDGQDDPQHPKSS